MSSTGVPSVVQKAGLGQNPEYRQPVSSLRPIWFGKRGAVLKRLTDTVTVAACDCEPAVARMLKV